MNGSAVFRSIALLIIALLVCLQEGLAQTAPIPVDVAQVRTVDVPLILQGIGTVQAFNAVTVRAQVDGVLQQVKFTEGQMVKAGDVLAQIDPRTYQAALDQVLATKAQHEAQLKNSEADLQRYTQLARSDFASEQQLATQQATVAQQLAQLQGDDAAISNARTQLSYTTLTSPIDGVAGIRLVDAGNLVRATDATGIVVITQIQPISVLFTLPAENLSEIRQAMSAGPLQVTIFERAGTTKQLGQGTLLLVNNQIDTATGQLQLKATLPNDDGSLWPGQFITARLLLRVDRGVPTVPGAAIQHGPDGYWVYVVKPDQTVEAQPVKVVRFGVGVAVLDGGPAPGAAVVSTGQYRLSPGARITVAQTQPAAPAKGASP